MIRRKQSVNDKDEECYVHDGDDVRLDIVELQDMNVEDNTNQPIDHNSPSPTTPGENSQLQLREIVPEQEFPNLVRPSNRHDDQKLSNAPTTFNSRRKKRATLSDIVHEISITPIIEDATREITPTPPSATVDQPSRFSLQSSSSSSSSPSPLPSSHQQQKRQQKQQDGQLSSSELWSLIQKAFVDSFSRSSSNNTERIKNNSVSTKTAVFDKEETTEQRTAPKWILLLKSIWNRLETSRDVIHLTLSEPKSSKTAQFISIFMLSLIIMSSISFCVSTLPQFYGEDEKLWFYLETMYIFVFSLEFLLRLITARNPLLFCTRILNILDFVSLLPYFLELILNRYAPSLGLNNSSGLRPDDRSNNVDLRLLRMARLVRIVRIFKISRHAKPIRVMFLALKDSTDVLYLALVFISVTLMVFSSIMYYLERGRWDSVHRLWYRCTLDDPVTGVCMTEEVSPYQSVFHSFWWGITTLTTVGYGDSYPVTSSGRVVAGVTMLFGVLVIALPSSMLGSKFEMKYQMFRENEQKKKMIQKEQKKQRKLEKKRSKELTAAAASTSSTDIESPSNRSHVFLSKLKKSVASDQLQKQMQMQQQQQLQTYVPPPILKQAVQSNRNDSNDSFAPDQMNTNNETEVTPTIKYDPSISPVRSSLTSSLISDNRSSEEFNRSKPGPLVVNPSSHGKTIQWQQQVICRLLIVDCETGQELVKKITVSPADQVLEQYVKSQLQECGNSTYQRLTSAGYELSDVNLTIGEYSDAKNQLSLEIYK